MHIGLNGLCVAAGVDVFEQGRIEIFLRTFVVFKEDEIHIGACPQGIAGIDLMIEGRRNQDLLGNIVILVIVYNGFTGFGILLIIRVGSVGISQRRFQGGLIVDGYSMRDAGSASIRYELTGVPVILHFPFRTIAFDALFFGT